MIEWESVILGDICKTNTTSYSNKDEWEYVNYLDTGNITASIIENIQHIDLIEEKLPSRAKRKVKKNSIIYSTVRPNQCHYGIIKDYPDNFLVSTGFTVIDIDEYIANADYIYYWLTQSIVTEKMHAIAEQNTSAYPSIKPTDLEELKIELPSLDIQKKVASILQTLNNKIETNNLINRNLEEQSKSIFKYRFLDFIPFGGVMPSDWRKLTLADVSELSAGGDKPNKVSSTPTEELNIPIYSNGISNGGLYGFTDVAKIFEESATVSARGTIGYVCLRQTPYLPIVRLVSLVPKCEYVSAKYLYHWLESLHISGTGTTQLQLTVPDFKKTRIVIPPKHIVDDFTETVIPLYNEIFKNKIENLRLSEVRDTLLRRLMTGKLDVSELDI